MAADDPEADEADAASHAEPATHSEAGGESADTTTSADGTEGPRGDVIVPMGIYKTVTVFSTLLAVLLVVGGMIALDTATARSRVAPEDIHLPTAILGVLAIVLGAAVYAFSTRFRAEGMGNSKDRDDEP